MVRILPLLTALLATETTALAVALPPPLTLPQGRPNHDGTFSESKQSTTPNSDQETSDLVANDSDFRLEKRMSEGARIALGVVGGLGALLGLGGMLGTVGMGILRRDFKDADNFSRDEEEEVTGAQLEKRMSTGGKIALSVLGGVGTLLGLLGGSVIGLRRREFEHVDASSDYHEADTPELDIAETNWLR